MQRGLQAAIQQWGRSFLHVTRKRREAVINMAEPEAEYLLKDPEAIAFRKEGCKHLLTEALYREDNDLDESREQRASARKSMASAPLIRQSQRTASRGRSSFK